jgi:peptidoglycan/xylan/chitin deacetylase (PgdA/CDA1 family)
MNLLIVNYHYYGTKKYINGIYPTTPHFFEKQISEISKKYTFLSQNQLASYIKENNYPKGDFCLITFDDGLKEQMQAFNWLNKNNIPAVFYIPTLPLIESKVLDVHKLHFVRANIEDIELIKLLKNNSHYDYNDVDAQNAAQQYKYDNSLAREIKYQLNFKFSKEAKVSFIENTFNKLFQNELLFSNNLYMNKQEIQLLSKANMLGSHGHAHIPLAKNLNAKDDIITSINYLENLTNKPIISFSYPYGSKAAVDLEVTHHFMNTNIAFALTMWRGNNDFSCIINPFQLFRIDTKDYFEQNQ